MIFPKFLIFPKFSIIFLIFPKFSIFKDQHCICFSKFSFFPTLVSKFRIFQLFFLTFPRQKYFYSNIFISHLSLLLIILSSKNLEVNIIRQKVELMVDQHLRPLWTSQMVTRFRSSKVRNLVECGRVSKR